MLFKKSFHRFIFISTNQEKAKKQHQDKYTLKKYTFVPFTQNLSHFFKNDYPKIECYILGALN